MVQSLDVLRQMVSDPWQMGRIAANHALSDLYACGARPVSALAAVTLPYASRAYAAARTGAAAGGRPARVRRGRLSPERRAQHAGSELSIGFAVNGVPMAPDGGLLHKTGALPGDQLVLTKPLGTGTLFAAHMQLAADGRDVSAAVASMLQSNGAAAELALAHGASACTDITGFGLLGHLLEMLGGELGARLVLADLPLLRGAIEQVRAGIVSTMHAANVRSGGQLMQHSQPVDAARLQMLFDPQTSGGLLIAIPAADARALCCALHQRDYVAASIIGEVTARTPGSAHAVEIG